MTVKIENTTSRQQIIIKKCHICGHIMESYIEVSKCVKCHKSFLPLNYFGKIHAKNSTEFRNLFATSKEIREEDLIKGLYTLW
ncbi:MAG: hypothetical protein ISR65_04830 [Bacteriovoracaceae bacterium]|nr:hypothetical protein [Bacteriovoracaceae bacterium]